MRCLTASLVLLSSNDYCCGLGINSGRGLRYDDMAQLYYVIELSVSLRNTLVRVQVVGGSSRSFGEGLSVRGAWTSSVQPCRQVVAMAVADPLKS